MKREDAIKGLKKYKERQYKIYRGLKFSIIYSKDDYMIEKGHFYPEEKESCKNLIKILRKQADILEKELEGIL